MLGHVVEFTARPVGFNSRIQGGDILSPSKEQNIKTFTQWKGRLTVNILLGLAPPNQKSLLNYDQIFLYFR